MGRWRANSTPRAIERLDKQKSLLVLSIPPQGTYGILSRGNEEFLLGVKENRDNAERRSVLCHLWHQVWCYHVSNIDTGNPRTAWSPPLCSSYSTSRGRELVHGSRTLSYIEGDTRIENPLSEGSAFDPIVVI